MEGKVAVDGRGAATPVGRISVGVVADDEATLGRLTSALAKRGLAVSARAGASDELVRQCAEHPPDAVVLAGALADERGPAAIRLLSQRLAETCVIVVSSSANRSRARAAVNAGAVGYVLESRVEDALAATVVAVCAGQVSVPNELRQLVGKPALANREKQVLAMVVLGFTNREIATKLHVAETTIKSHLSSAFKKLGVRSRKEAVATILDPHEGLGAGILTISGDAN